MNHQYFVDRVGALSNVRRTAVGGMLVDATLAKVGVMDYLSTESHRPGEKPKKPLVRRYNPPEALASAVADVATAPVTYGHPARFVDVHSYQSLSKGHVVGTPVFENGHIKATLAINDAALIRAIELGECREVSMGYQAYHDETPGTTPEGEQYDESRTKIEWNHIAIVPAGRAGKTVRLMLDSADIPREESQMALKINGIEVAADAAQAAFDTFEAGLQVKLADLQKQLDTAVAAKTAAEAALAEKTSDAALDALVTTREAKKAADAAKVEKLAKVKLAYPAVNLDGRSDEFVDGLFAGLAAKPASDADPEGLNALGRPSVVTKDANAKQKPESSAAAHARMRAEDRAASMKPVGANPEA